MQSRTARWVGSAILCLVASLAVLEAVPEARVSGPAEWREPLAARYHLRTRTSKFYKRAVRQKSAKV